MPRMVGRVWHGAGGDGHIGSRGRYTREGSQKVLRLLDGASIRVRADPDERKHSVESEQAPFDGPNGVGTLLLRRRALEQDHHNIFGIDTCNPWRIFDHVG